MSTFFQQTAQAMIAKHIDRFPLLKLDQVIDWQPIEHYLNRQKTRYLRDHRGRPAYPLLSMFKAVLLGQWNSLSDPELEHSLITRIDFNLFCRFDELSIPDYSTLCRYRNWLAQDDTLLDSDFKCNTSVLVVGTDSRIKHLAFRSQVFFLVGGS
ncbi:transposase, partial [Neisseria meningitidis]|uniref:transposase n=4 Tax=Neisseria meningitidis TaxID=487 RepID=UPI000A521266